MSRTLSVHQEHELLLMLEKAGLTSEEAQAIVNSKQNQLANGIVGWLREQLALPASGSQFDRYSGLLLSLEDQLGRLRAYNDGYWGNRLSAKQLAAIDTSSDHVQRVDDLQILHVSFGSPEQDIEMWWKVFVGEQPNAWRWDGLRTDAQHLRLFDRSAQRYEPGIHRVKLDLVAHWEPDQGRSIEQVREQARATGEILANSEVLSAYGLHSELLREQDGENLPYADMAGFEATVPGDQPWTYCPCLNWSRVGRVVGLGARWLGCVGGGWAAPVFREL